MCFYSLIFFLHHQVSKTKKKIFSRLSRPKEIIEIYVDFYKLKHITRLSSGFICVAECAYHLRNCFCCVFVLPFLNFLWVEYGQNGKYCAISTFIGINFSFASLRSHICECMYTFLFGWLWNENEKNTTVFLFGCKQMQDVRCKGCKEERRRKKKKKMKLLHRGGP